MREKFLLFIAFFIMICSVTFHYQDIVWEFLKEFCVIFTPTPKVSVVTSSYNMGETLPYAIESILAQTYTDWEMIVIDDGSDDNTAKYLRPYRKNLKIRIITNRKNIGLVSSLNKGIEKARGKYIARLDADDISYPNRLERTIALMEKENLDIAGAWCEERNYYNKNRKNNFDTNSICLAILKGNFFCHSTMMYRKSFLDEHSIRYNEKSLNAEDYDFYMQAYLKGAKFGYIGGEPLSIYHRTTHSKAWFEFQTISARETQKYVLSKIIPNFDESLLKLPLDKLIPHIIEGNKITGVLDQKNLEDCYKNKSYNIYNNFWQNP